MECQVYGRRGREAGIVVWSGTFRARMFHSEAVGFQRAIDGDDKD